MSRKWALRWNGDAEFDTSDLVLAFQDGDYADAVSARIPVALDVGVADADALGRSALSHHELQKLANVDMSAEMFQRQYAAVFDKARRPAWIALSVVLTVLVLATLLGCPGHAQYVRVR